MNSKDFRMLFLYEWKSKQNAAAAAQDINAALENDSVSEHTIRLWFAMFETGDEKLTKR